MDIYSAIEKRRTIRKFKGTASGEQLNRIIKAATLSPSSGNKQNWEFVVVEKPELINKIAEIKYVMNRGKPLGEKTSEEKEEGALKQKSSFSDASLIVVFHNKELADSAGVWCCIENMLLAAVAEDLGTRIARFQGGAANAVNELLNAPKEMEVVAAISIGIPSIKPGPRKLRPDGIWLHRNSF